MRIVNMNKHYDKYEFALKGVKSAFYDEFYVPHIVIKYITKDKNKNINFFGYPFKDLTYSIPAKNNNEEIQEIYNHLNNSDILEGTKYLLLKYPNHIDKIINQTPSFVFTEQEFVAFLFDIVDTLPDEKKVKCIESIKKRLNGIKKFTEENNSTHSKSL